MGHAHFRRAVQTYKRERVLAGLGALTVTAFEAFQASPNDIAACRPVFPWQAGLVAREALLAGSNSTSAAQTPTTARLIELCRRSDEIDQAAFHSGDLATFGLRTAYLQFPYSEAQLGRIARTRLMFERDLSSNGFEVLSNDTLTDVIGGPLDVFVDSAVFFFTAAMRNGGRFDERWLTGPQFDPVRARIDLDQLVSVFTQAWSSNLPALRAKARSSTSDDPLARPFDWNPLMARPFVRLGDGSHVAPNAWWAYGRVSPTAIYHLGMERHGEAWARDLGRVQEQYIVQQLRQLEPTARVVPEFAYNTSHGDVRSVDAFLVFDDLVVIVESKSLRARLDSTTAADSYQARLQRDLTKAYGKQLPRSLTLVRAGAHQLGQTPTDVLVVALVVTPDPLYLANSPTFTSGLPSPGMPTAVVSLTELENLIAACLVTGTSEIFKSATAVGPNGYSDPNSALRSAFAEAPPDNPLLLDAFKRGHWANIAED